MFASKQSTIICFLLFSFLICSWPFVRFPLTDADIAHWVGIAREISIQHNFLTSANDQAHGPLLAWTAGLWVNFAPQSLYLYNLFNLLCGVLGVGLMYFFAEQLWPKQKVSGLAAFLFSTCLVQVYLSRTPMYDWPTAIFYFGFGGFYLLHVRGDGDAAWGGEAGDAPRQRLYVGLALLSIAIASLSRFSVSVGLAGIFMLGCNFIYRRPLWTWVRDGILIWAVTIAANLPWILGQMQAHGYDFLNVFLYDNIGRYFKEPQVDAPVHHDYYGFVLYALIAIIPYTFCLLATLFQKPFWKRLMADKLTQGLVLGFLPCLLIFSFSGHVKLLRYIACVFPFLILLLSQQMALHDLDSAAWRKRCGRMTLVTVGLLLLLLGSYIVKFPNEVRSAGFFVASVFGLLFGLLLLSYRLVSRHAEDWRARPTRYLWSFGLLYILFFSIVTYENMRAPFLVSVDQVIQANIGSGFPLVRE